MTEAISQAVRAARRPLRLEICGLQRALAGLLAVSVMGNAVLYGLLHYSDAAHKSEVYCQRR